MSFVSIINFIISLLSDKDNYFSFEDLFLLFLWFIHIHCILNIKMVNYYFQLYYINHIKLHFDEMMVNVLVIWNNSWHVDVSLHFDTFSWIWVNQSLSNYALIPTRENWQIPIFKISGTQGELKNYYTNVSIKNKIGILLYQYSWRNLCFLHYL